MFVGRFLCVIYRGHMGRVICVHRQQECSTPQSPFDLQGPDITLRLITTSPLCQFHFIDTLTEMPGSNPLLQESLWAFDLAEIVTACARVHDKYHQNMPTVVANGGQLTQKRRSTMATPPIHWSSVRRDR
jgi:hypothetical protein